MAQIITVGSYRRAVGKSLIAANLAAQASLMGWRVGVAELNVLYPYSQTSLSGIPDSVGSLAGYLRGEVPIDSVGADAFADLGENAALWVFPWGSTSLWEKVDLDPTELSRRLQTLAAHRQLDFLILDLGSGMTDFNLLMSAISDCCLIITRPDQMDYQGTALMVELVRSMNDPWLLLIANQVLAQFDTAQVRQQVSSIFHAPTSVLPFAEAILEMGSQGLFSLQAADHPWSRAIRSIAASLFADLAGRTDITRHPVAGISSAIRRRINEIIGSRRKLGDQHTLPRRSSSASPKAQEPNHA